MLLPEHLNIVLFSSKWSLSLLFPHQIPVRTCPLPFVLCAPLISYLFIWLSEKYLIRRTDHWAPHYVVFSTPLLPRPSRVYIFSSATYCQTPSAYVSPSMWATSFHAHTKQQAKYSSVCFNIYTFGQQDRGQKIAATDSKQSLISIWSLFLTE
jgi:hypothetical protein